MIILGLRIGRTRTAAEWFAHLQRYEVAPEIWIEFLEWLEASPQNRAEFRRVEELWSALGQVAEHKRVSEETCEIRSWPAPKKLGRAQFHGGLALAASIVLVVLGGWWATEVGTVRNVQTPIGEQRSLTLADGSHITLNANSSLRIDYRFGRRNMFLERGEALFTVAHDESHPFVVRTAQAVVTAVGTEFAIAVYEKRIDVNVLEGRVRAEADHATAPESLPMMLTAGEAGHLTDGDPKWIRSQADVSRIRMWQAKRLEFRQATLESVVAEFNKLSSAQIVLGDRQVAALRVSGVFRAGHTDSLLGALTKLYPIRVQTDSNQVVLHYSELPPKIGRVMSAPRDSNL